MDIFMVVLDRAKCAAGCALTPRAATDVIMQRIAADFEGTSATGTFLHARWQKANSALPLAAGPPIRNRHGLSHSNSWPRNRAGGYQNA